MSCIFSEPILLINKSLHTMKKHFTLLLILCLFASIPAIGQNDDCANAIDISNLLGGAIGQVNTSGQFDNSSATPGADDPATGFECWLDGIATGVDPVPSIENSVWFTFAGDGNTYTITATDCGGTANPYNNDTQFALFSGSCGSLVSVDCNDDAPFVAAGGPWPSQVSFPTVAGTDYILLVDGWSGTSGNFCFDVVQEAAVGCDDISAGVFDVSQTTVCDGETFDLTEVTAGVVPITNFEEGFEWAVFAGTPPTSGGPSADPNYQGSFGRELASYGITFDASSFFDPGTYFFVPVVSGNIATDAAGDLDYSNACVVYGTPVEITLLAVDDPNCVQVTCAELTAGEFSANSINFCPNDTIRVSIDTDPSELLVSRMILMIFLLFIRLRIGQLELIISRLLPMVTLLSLTMEPLIGPRDVVFIQPPWK